MAQRNILEVAPLQSYNQTLNYYNRVTNDSGTLIVPYDVDRIYHALNLLSLQNRSYKLYHASAGLQKTSDQIDKLYDLGKNDVDQTFSGSDRPEHVQEWSNSEGVGNWQISVEKEATNYCKESSDLGGIFGGNWTKTEGAGDSPFGDPNEAVEVSMNTNSTGASNYIELDVDTATNFSSGDYITVSFYAKKIAGSSGQPELLIEGEDGNSNPISLIQETFSTQAGEYQFFEFTAQWSANGTLRQAGCRIQDNDTSADTVYQFWGVQIERGQYATSRIHTDGGIATRLASNSILQNFFPLTGTIASWCDFLYDEDMALQMIFDTVGDSSNTKRSSIYFIYSAKALKARVYGDNGGFILNQIPFNFSSKKRYVIGQLTTWDVDFIYLYIANNQGDIYKYSSAHDLNDTTGRDCGFGANFSGKRYSSFRFLSMKSIKEEVTDNSERAINILSSLSKVNNGPNLDPSDFTPQNFTL